jgi:hypothetical protein
MRPALTASSISATRTAFLHIETSFTPLQAARIL